MLQESLIPQTKLHTLGLYMDQTGQTGIFPQVLFLFGFVCLFVFCCTFSALRKLYRGESLGTDSQAVIVAPALVLPFPTMHTHESSWQNIQWGMKGKWDGFIPGSEGLCGKAAPALPEQGQKEPRLLKVHAFKLTDTVSNPGASGGGTVTSWGWVQGLHKPEAASPSGLRVVAGDGHCAGQGGGGAGPAVGASAPWARVGCLSWGELRFRRGAVSLGALTAPAQNQMRFPVSGPSAVVGVYNPSVALKEKTSISIR